MFVDILVFPQRHERVLIYDTTQVKTSYPVSYLLAAYPVESLYPPLWSPFSIIIKKSMIETQKNDYGVRFYL